MLREDYVRYAAAVHIDGARFLRDTVAAMLPCYAMNACKSAGVSDVIIVGFDGNESAVKLIMDGELVKATVDQQPYEMGYQVVEAAVKAVKGESVDEVINAPVQVVTAENGQAYLDNLAAMKG